MPKVSTATSASACGGQNYINHGLDEKQDWMQDMPISCTCVRQEAIGKAGQKNCSRDYQNTLNTK
jgi:hypothetical protein